MIDKKSVLVSLAVVLLVVSAGYYLNTKYLDGTKGNVSEAGMPEHQEIKTISIGILSDDAVKQIKELQPAVNYIAAKLSDNKTKYEGKVVVANNIDNVTDLLKEQKLDLFINSPFTVILVSKKSGSVPFLRGWRDGVAQYHTLIFVSKNSSINTLEDFVGKTMAFPNTFSSSSYLLPKAFLIERGFKFNQSAGKDQIGYVFSGSDEDTVLWVIEGKADIGALSSLDYENLPQSRKDQLKIINRTVDVPRHVMSYRSGLEPALLERIKKILLNMENDPKGVETLRTKKYDELSRDDISSISRMVDLLE